MSVVARNTWKLEQTLVAHITFFYFDLFNWNQWLCANKAMTPAPLKTMIIYFVWSMQEFIFILLKIWISKWGHSKINVMLELLENKSGVGT